MSGTITPTVLLYHSNLLSLITAPLPDEEELPRITQFELIEFLSHLVEEFFDQQPYILADASWKRNVVQAAERGRSHFAILSDLGEEFLDAPTLRLVLSDLWELFGSYSLFGMIVGKFEDENALQRHVQAVTRESKGKALVLDALCENNRPIVGVLDPRESVAMMIEKLEYWPGIVLWSRNGNSAFLPEVDLTTRGRDTFSSLVESIRDPYQLDTELARLKENWTRSKSILHLSDLHFGEPTALRNSPRLLSRLASTFKHVDRTVITGDLITSPSDEATDAFNLFLTAVRQISPKDPILIPGNHDQKWHGLGSGNQSQLVRLVGKHPRVEIDEDMRTVFLCFDSSREKRWGANGQISREQMKELETEYSIAYEQFCKRRSESLNGYLSIALMHHHPFTFKDGSGTRIQRFFDYLEEIGLRLHDAENFHHWCGNKQVSLVLHGHKHIPRHVQKKIVFREEILAKEETFVLESIGCGTSLGAEDYNLSYDVLFWDPVSLRWAVTFWQDSGQGIFKRQFVKTEPQ